ncbi:hypothetical protein OIU78_011611, partial [Salix suchowensis]
MILCFDFLFLSLTWLSPRRELVPAQHLRSLDFLSLSLPWLSTRPLPAQHPRFLSFDSLPLSISWISPRRGGCPRSTPHTFSFDFLSLSLSWPSPRLLDLTAVRSLSPLNTSCLLLRFSLLDLTAARNLPPVITLNNLPANHNKEKQNINEKTKKPPCHPHKDPTMQREKTGLHC